MWVNEERSWASEHNDNEYTRGRLIVLAIACTLFIAGCVAAEVTGATAIFVPLAMLALVAIIAGRIVWEQKHKVTVPVWKDEPLPEEARLPLEA